jgi:hypothetical protein
LALLHEYDYEVDGIGLSQDEIDDAAWNANFDKLLLYKKEHDGRFVVAKNENKDNKTLYAWIVSQRYKERHEILSPDKRKRLVDDGFEFRRCKPPCKKRRYTEKQEKKGDEMYAELMQLPQGSWRRHCQVPRQKLRGAGKLGFATAPKLSSSINGRNTSTTIARSEFYMEYSTKAVTSTVMKYVVTASN